MIQILFIILNNKIHLNMCEFRYFEEVKWKQSF